MRHTLDSDWDNPEQIAYCLHCDKPAAVCNHCSGPPREIVPTPPKRRRGYPQEVRDRAMQLVDSGMRIEFAARECGVGASTLAAWLCERRRAAYW